MVELLLQLGVNLKSYESRSGRTALHLATELHEPAVVDRLVCYGADLNARTFSGCTPLHLAVGLGDEGTSVLLCHLGANLHVRNGEDDSPMDLAETFPQVRLTCNRKDTGAHNWLAHRSDLDTRD